MMDISKADDIHIGNVPVQSAWLGGRKVWDRTERKIMRSMVCWYDISRQGCTNESMAQNPVLKDLSGNGNDMQCFNFAWAGMSGIGGYRIDPSLWGAGEMAQTDRDGNRIKITYESDQLLGFATEYSEQCVGFRVRFIGFNGKKISLNLVLADNSRYTRTLFEDGSGDDVTVTIPRIEEVEYGTRLNTFRFLVSPKSGEGTIEFLPDYPGALVSDGVDDYCRVEGLPALTDYTVVARRLYSGFGQTGNVNASLATKREAAAAEDGAFQFERFSDENIKTFNFGASLDIKEAIDGSPSVSWQTAGSYNGDALAKGGAADTQSLSLFCLRKGSAANPLKAALYSFLLFDRTLTDAEIEWVKANLVEPPLPQPAFYYDFSKYRRQDFLNADEPVLQDQAGGSNTLTLYNQNKAGCGFEVGLIDFTDLIQSDQSLGLANANSYTTEPQKMHLTRLGGINGTFYISQVNGNLLQYIKDDYINFKVTVNSLPPGVEIGLEMYSSGIGGGPVMTVYVSESCVVRFEEGEYGTQFNVATRAADGYDEITPCDCDVIIESVNSNFKGAFFTGGRYESYMKGTFAPSSGTPSGKCTLFMLMNLTYQNAGAIADFGNLGYRDGPEFAIAVEGGSFIPDAFTNDYNSNDTYINNRYNDPGLDLDSKLVVPALVGKKVLAMIKGDVQKDSDVFTVGRTLNENPGSDSPISGLAVYKILMFNEELTQEQIDRVIDKYSLMEDVDDVWAIIDGTEDA